MSTPPKYMQNLRAQEQTTLITALRLLAEKWPVEHAADTMSTISGEVVAKACAKDLEDLLRSRGL